MFPQEQQIIIVQYTAVIFQTNISKILLQNYRNIATRAIEHVRHVFYSNIRNNIIRITIQS